MIIISDTTAISNLIQIEEFELLKDLYQKIILPKGVHEELSVLSTLGIPIEEILQKDWIKVEKVNSWEMVEKFTKDLDQGEAEAIALAIEMNADYLLIDEKEGRKIARKNQIKIVGTIGILLNGKKSGLIKSVKEKMDELRKIGFWISDHLYHEIIKIEERI